MADEKKMTIAMSKEFHGKLKALAAIKGISIKDLILETLVKAFPELQKE